MITIKGTDGNYNTYNGALYNKDKTKLLLCPQGRTTSSHFIMAGTTNEIGDYAFYNCSKLTSVLIPEGVTKIGDNSFYKHKSDFRIYGTQDTYAQTYANNHSIPFCASYSYTKNSDGTITITKYNDIYTSISIPSKINGYSVTSIGKEAFKNNSTITSVSIPYGISSIGNDAFRSCYKLASVSLPNSLNTINSDAFCYCTSLKEVVLPSNVTLVGTRAFYGCTELTSVTLNNKLNYINSYAFENTGLTSVYIPQNVRTIGSYAFGFEYKDSTHTRNANFTLIKGYPDTTAQTYATNNNIPFQAVLEYSVNSNGTDVTITNYTGTETALVLPNSINGLPVTSIAGYAFNNTAVTSVTLPNSMTQLNNYAFYGASKLQSVTFPSTITSIGSYAFEFCTSLKSITIPNTITSIKNGAFYGCTSLSNVKLGSGLKTIGSCSFCNTALQSITIPKNVTNIGEHAFGYTYKNSTYSGVENYTMTGYAYTAADDYASHNEHITFNALYEGMVNISTISADNIELGESITVNASATGGKLPYTYSLTYKGSSDEWKTVQNFSTNSSIQFTPTAAGEYSLCVTVRDDRGVSSAKYYTVIVKEVEKLVNHSTISKTQINLGESITVTGNASGGQNPYTYGVYYKKSTSSQWTTAQSYKANATVTIQLAAAVKYDICVKVKDSTGVIEKKYFTVNVVKPLTNNSTISSESVKLGQSVTITGKASGGQTPYTYGVYYKKSTSSQWTTAQSYKENATVKITPAAAVKYDVCVKVKDSTGKIEKKYFVLTVTK